MTVVLSGPPLLVTADRVLADSVRQLAAAVGVEVVVTDTPAAAGRRWVEAGLVLLGDDVTPQSLPAARDGVVLLTRQAAAATWQRAAEVGAGRVLALPGAEAPLAEALLAVGSVSPGGRVVGVLGSVGGCGATTLTVALASGQPPGRALVVDGDTGSGGLDLALGTELEPGLRWRDLVGVRGAMRPEVLVSSLPAIEGLRLLTWGVWDDEIDSPAVSLATQRVELLPLDAMRSVVQAARAVTDLTVVDLVRRLDTCAAQHWRLLDLAVLLVPAHVRGVLAGRMALARLAAVVPDVRVAVRLPPRGGLGLTAVEDALDQPVVAWPSRPRLAAAAEGGDLLHAVRAAATVRDARNLSRLLPGARGLGVPGAEGAA